MFGQSCLLEGKKCGCATSNTQQMYCQCLPLFDAIQNAYDNKWEAILLSHIDILLKQRGGGQRKIKQLKKFHGLKNLKHDFLIMGFYQSLWPSFRTAFDAVGLLTSLALQLSISSGFIFLWRRPVLHLLLLPLPDHWASALFNSTLSLPLLDLTLGPDMPLAVLVQ